MIEENTEEQKVEVEEVFQFEALMSNEEGDEIVNSINNLPEDGLMVEWGSGASTLYWMAHLQPTQSLISIEHNQEWFEKVSEDVKDTHLADHLHSFKYYFRPPMYEDVELTYATVKEEHPYGMRDYILPDEDILKAELCFIDGVARASVILSMLAYSKNPATIYYLHDYVGREHWYDWVVDYIPFKRVIEGTKLLKFCKIEDGLYA